VILTFQDFDKRTVFLYEVENINSVAANSKLHIDESGLNKNGSLIQVKKHFILTGCSLLSQQYDVTVLSLFQVYIFFRHLGRCVNLTLKVD
jgi:hypothetical protein